MLICTAWFRRAGIQAHCWFLFWGVYSRPRSRLARRGEVARNCANVARPPPTPHRAAWRLLDRAEPMLSTAAFQKLWCHIGSYESDSSFTLNAQDIPARTSWVAPPAAISTVKSPGMLSSSWRLHFSLILKINESARTTQAFVMAINNACSHLFWWYENTGCDYRTQAIVHCSQAKVAFTCSWDRT